MFPCFCASVRCIYSARNANSGSTLRARRPGIRHAASAAIATSSETPTTTSGSVENGRLFTMYRPLGLMSTVRRSQEEAVIALDAESGKTIWEYRYGSPTAGADFSQGAGPHATPLLVGNRLFTVGSRREFFALDKNTGRVLWSHDLIKDYGAPSVNRGMANSPLLYNNTVLLPIGGKSQALGAFNPETGALVWKAGDVEYAPASPVLIGVDGQTQVVLFGGDRIAGMDPSNGKTLWSHPHKTDYGLNISTPIWSPADRLLIFSSAYGTGSRALELRQSGGATTVVEKWALGRVRAHIGIIIPDRRHGVHVERRLRPVVSLRGQRQDRRHGLAGPRFRPRAAAICRR